MASLLDALQLLENIGIIRVLVPFLLVLVVIYALLEKTEIFGKSATINLTISASIALLFISFKQAVAFVIGIVPMFLGLFIVILLMYMLFSFMGVKAETIGEVFASNTSVLIFIILMMLVFVALLLPNLVPSAYPYSEEGQVVADEATITSLDTGETLTVATQRTVSSEATKIFYNPAVIGTIALLLVAAGTLYFITAQRKMV